jgi:hypothetical protein
MRRSRPRPIFITAALSAVLIATSVAACVDKTVFRDGPIFDEPPTAAAGFLGYDDQATKLTVCGNCHVGQQARWETTAHADAWATLMNSGHSQATCEGCHTVNPRGNVEPGPNGGYIGTGDERYHDVQCESCHGPGLTHVENPDASQPLAPITVGVTLTSGCGECHNGTHNPFVEEWSQSRHSRVTSRVLSSIASDPAHAVECLACHTAQGALEAWGIDAEYLERDDALADYEPVVCAVCHDPHGRRPGQAPIEKQLRFSVGVPSQEQNLCIKCHHKRSQPDIDPVTLDSRGPHSPEGPLLLGEDVGFWFGELPYDNQKIVGTHGSAGNPRLCATCHIDRFTVVDQETGDFQFQVTGHQFRAIPCVDANGRPTVSNTCAVTARTFRSCTNAGCHGSEDAARSAKTLADQRINTLAAQLLVLIDQKRATEISSSDGRWTVAEGANFNYLLTQKRGSTVHNPFLMEALMIVSIQAMRDTYGLSVPEGLSLSYTLGAD